MRKFYKIINLIALAGIFFLSAYQLNALGFIKNYGQWNKEVRFKAELKDGNLWITDSALVFDFFQPEFDANGQKIERIDGEAFHLRFRNENLKDIELSDPADASINYLKGRDESKWITNAKIYDKLTFKDIHIGLDLRLIVQDGYLYLNTDKPDSSLKLYYGIGKPDSFKYIRLCSNQNFYKICWIKKTESIEYKQTLDLPNTGNKIKVENGIIQFNIEKNLPKELEHKNINAKLLDNIESPLIYSTFLGGNNFDIVRDVACDIHGNVYLTGHTSSPDFPISDGAYSKQFSSADPGWPDVFVTKLDSLGERILYSTYIGGYGDDYSEAIKVDTSGFAYIAGYTFQLETFPYTTGAYDTTTHGGYDAFVLKLAKLGNALVYSTFLGSDKDDFAEDVLIDSIGNAFVAGYTASSKFPVVNSSYVSPFRGEYDAFVAKLNVKGNSLLWSAVVSGSLDDFCQSIALDKTGSIFLTGITRSTDFPATIGAFSQKLSDTGTSNKISDAYIAKLSSNGRVLQSATYLGGVSRDASYSVNIVDNVNPVVAGYTESPDFPHTAGAFDTTLNNGNGLSGIGDGFVTKFNSDLSHVMWSTFIGGLATDSFYGLSSDTTGFLYVTGSTNSSDYPVTQNAIQKKLSGDANNLDAIITKLSPDGAYLMFSSYWGGTGNDVGNAIALDGNIIATITGRTESKDFPVSQFAYDTTSNDSLKGDVFSAKIRTPAIYINVPDSIFICGGNPVQIGNPAIGGAGGYTYSWSPRAGLTTPDSARTFVMPDSTTEYTVTVSDTAGNVESKTVKIIVSSINPIFISGSRIALKDSIFTYAVDSEQDLIYDWRVQNGVITAQPSPNSVKIKWSDTANGKITLIVHNLDGCSDTVNLSVVSQILYHPKISVAGNGNPCEGGAITLDAGAGFTTYEWNNGAQTRQITVNKSGNYWAFVIDNQGIGGITDTVKIDIKPAPALTITGPKYVGIDSTAEYSVEKIAGFSYRWNSIGGVFQTSDTLSTVSVKFGELNPSLLFVYAENSSGCKIGDSIVVFVGAFKKPVISSTTQGVVCEGDTTELDAGAGYKYYYWSTQSRSRSIKVTEPGSYWVRVTDYLNNVYYSDTMNLQMVPKPTKPKIAFSGVVLRSVTIADSYQWYYQGAKINGETLRQFKPNKDGYYQVEITAKSGCSNISDSLLVQINSIDEVAEKNNIIITVESNKILKIYNNNESQYSVTVYDGMGRVMNELLLQPLTNLDWDLSNYAPGLYFIKLQSPKGTILQKIILP